MRMMPAPSALLVRASPNERACPLAATAAGRERRTVSITELDSATGAPARVGRLHAVPDTPSGLREGLVHRGPLVRRLIAGHDAALAVLLVRAGYGKTPLLRQWEQADAHPFEWLAADRPGEIVARLARPREGGVLVIDDFHAVRSAAALR